MHEKLMLCRSPKAVPAEARGFNCSVGATACDNRHFGRAAGDALQQRAKRWMVNLYIWRERESGSFRLGQSSRMPS